MSSQEMTRISEIMNTPVESIKLHSSVQDIALKMKEKRVSSVLVIDDETDTPLGIITERDLSIKACILDKSSKEIPSKQIMSSPLFTINEDSSPMDAADLMLKNKVRHVLVVSNESGNEKNNENEKTSKPVGIITPMDLTRFQFESAPKQKDENDKIKILLDHYKHEFDFFP